MQEEDIEKKREKSALIKWPFSWFSYVCESFERIKTVSWYSKEKKKRQITASVFLAGLDRDDFMAYQCVCRNALGTSDAVVRLYRKLWTAVQPISYKSIALNYFAEIHSVSAESEMNEVYQDSDQQDSRGN